MYRPGHYGVALLTYAPLGFLLAAGGYVPAAIASGTAVLLLTTLPDYDQRVPFVSHRGATHTLAFAVAVGFVLAGAATYAGGTTTRRLGVVGTAFAVGVLAVGAHLLADAITPAGIRPFWPLSRRTYSLDLATADDPLWNYALLGLGVLATASALLGARTVVA